MPDAPETYPAAYAILRRNAETLQNAAEPDIDALVPLVQESVQAYGVCKARLEAARKALAESLGDGAGAPQ